MIEFTNETITIPMIQICTSNGFWSGFVLGGIFVLLFCLLFKVIIAHEAM